ncbi:MAG: hypothetical protein A3G41_06555 [Elusimicrobia bacterium RIFCSPLOWO2_12_FULL_59_9]|nr:MAG: hypothetical protein A3G41_06555 [Elusimicrobia bacterium RIFCSPLOWO2_12_FULL_59_9]
MPRARPAKPSVVVSGISLGLPGSRHKIFDDQNFERILRGENLIEPLSREEQQKQLDKNITRLVKTSRESRIETVDSAEKTVRLAAKGGKLDLKNDFGISPEFAATLDRTAELALPAALLALKDARIPLENHILPRSLSQETGIIFASALPGLSSLASELKGDRFNRHFILKAMPLAHAQIAQWIGSKGPAIHLNAGFASTPAALSLAEDWIRLGRAKRVLVASADDATGPELQEWVLSAFLSMGAASTGTDAAAAALPFDQRRHGTIIGMGAAGFVVEAQEETLKRGLKPLVRIIATEQINWGHHLTRLDAEQIIELMEKTLKKAEAAGGLERKNLSNHLLYMSHETYTPAKGGSAQSEIKALKQVFGKDFSKVLICNTKGYTGHTLGAGVEDAALIKMLETGRAPKIANLKKPDPEFAGAKFSDGSPHRRRYGLHVALGFGSQGACVLFEKMR